MKAVVKKTFAVKRYKVTKEYIWGLLEIAHSEEAKEMLQQSAKDMKEVYDEKYYQGAIAGFTLAVFLTHNPGEEI